MKGAYISLRNIDMTMDTAEKKLAALKKAIDQRLQSLYLNDETAQSNEAKTLEYLMCMVEIDNEDDYASKCLRKIYW